MWRIVAVAVTCLVPMSANADLVRDTLGNGTVLDGAVMLDRNDNSWGVPGIVVRNSPAGKLGEWSFRVAGFEAGDTPVPFVLPAQYDVFDWSLWVGTEAEYLSDARGDAPPGSTYMSSDGLAVTVLGTFPNTLLVTDLSGLNIPVSGDFVLSLKALSSNPGDGTIVLGAYDGIAAAEDLFAGNFAEFGSSYTPGEIVSDHGFAFGQFAVQGDVISVPEVSSFAMASTVIVIGLLRFFLWRGAISG